MRRVSPAEMWKLQEPQETTNDLGDLWGRNELVILRKCLEVVGRTPVPLSARAHARLALQGKW